MRMRGWRGSWGYEGHLLRVFCGLEDVDDLWEDLQRGFSALRQK